MITDEQRSESMGQATREKLKQYIARIERLNAEKDELLADIREVYAESKTFGFDTKILRTIIKNRKIEAAERAEQDALVELYEDAINGCESTPDTPDIAGVEAILMNADGSRETILVEMLMTSLTHNNRFYAHYTENAYRQVGP